MAPTHPSGAGKSFLGRIVASLKSPRPGGFAALAAGLILLLLSAASASASLRTGVAFPGSIRRIPTAAEAGPGVSPRTPVITRTTLTPAETEARIEVEVALKMRNFDELQARIARGELISQAEMSARYLPLESDQARLLAWFRSQGLEVTRADSSRLAVFARAPVSTVATAFDTTFARVSVNSREYTSAITAPSLPSDIAPTVAGIHGLQQHQRLRLLSHLVPLSPQAASSTTPPYLPAQILAAYDASSSGLTGAGQTIAIFAVAYPLNNDLAGFWSASASPASTSNVTTVNVNGGPSSTTDAGALQEASLDVEWAGAIAPGAAIRIYGADLSDATALDQAFLQVYADLPSHPTLHQYSISFGYGEAEADQDYLLIESQYVAALASAGVTVFASAGDNGAYADTNAPSLLQVNYPASDPNVTGVGGTTMYLKADGTVSSETVWGPSGGSTGGGISGYFPRPSWQAGTGVPTGSYRLVPDVALAADPKTGAVIYVSGKQLTIGGTSWGTPVWAGFCALLNQSRSNAGLGPLGVLNPRLYPLLGTNAFRDVVSGNNGTYYASAGYDLCTGIGVPDFGNLLQSTLTYSGAPLLVAQFGDRFTTLFQGATFAVSAAGTLPLSYAWQRKASGSSTWSNLSDGGAYSGASTADLQVLPATAAMNGDQFRCVVSNSVGSVTSSPASALTVAATGVSTLAGWAGAFGSDDGLASRARFNFTGSVRVDPAGNIYVADAQNYTIRKITPSGTVSTVAGTAGVAGTTDGDAAGALFGGAGGVAIDSAGNVFVADTGNYTIRKITPSGIVSTFAGLAGTSGRIDGTGSAARFTDPENLAIDASDNLYVADGSGNTIRKVTPAGVVTTYAGSAYSGSTDGPAASASFRNPLGIAVDASGNVYVGDSGNHTVRKITPAGVVSTLAGVAGAHGSTDGAGYAARFYGPAGLTVDVSGNVYVADSLNDTIRKITSSGVVSTVAGSAGLAEGTDGPFVYARFAQPADVALDPAGNLVVADAGNNTVRLVVLSAATAPSIATNPAGATVTAGQTATLSVSATGTAPFSYQWYKDGSAVPGATSSTCTISTVTSEEEGAYTCVVSNEAGSATSASASIVVDPLTASNPNARLSSISSRTYVQTDANEQIAGFAIQGATAKTVMIRAAGPALNQFGITNYLADPTIELHDQSTGAVIATNDNWGDDPTQVSAFTAAFSSTGAFTWPSGSKDAAMIVTLNPGLYTAVIKDKNGGSGVALAEVYDIDKTGPRMVDISTRSVVGSGQSVQVAGFVISGTGLKTVLIRASGPALAQFNLTGYVPNPTLTLYNQATQTAIASNDNWGDDAHKAPQIKAAAASVSAFAWPDGSNDAALLVTLRPGIYSAETTDKSGTEGVGLIEVYEVK